MQDQKSSSPAATTTTITKAGSSSQLSIVLALITLAQFMIVVDALPRFLASSSRAKKALSLILKDLVTVFSGTFDQTLELYPDSLISTASSS